jgi:UDP-2-acetamido-2-deoxy-ribo-hexuluronate aminotransferase
MRNINMVDLKSQYEKIQDQIDSEVLKVIRSTKYINGPIVQEFADNLAKYVGVKYVVPCANGTDSLLASLMAFDLQPGDEVITSTFTFIATAEVISLLGLTPVLVDILPNTFNLNPEEVEKAITKNTKAIIPVHLFGQCADMEPILEIAKKHNLYVIEDACQAIGSEYTFRDRTVKQAGNMGDTGCISFFPSKNLGCSHHIIKVIFCFPT